MSDNGKKIKVILETGTVKLDKNSKASMGRYVLSRVLMVYDIDQDFTLTLYGKKNEDMEFEPLTEFIVPSSQKRFNRRIMHVGGLIDYYFRLEGDFKRLTISTFKVFETIKNVGKFI